MKQGPKVILETSFSDYLSPDNIGEDEQQTCIISTPVQDCI